MRRPLEMRFWEKVDFTRGGCWEFASRNGAGYGTLSVNGGSVAAHRLAWEISHQESIPGGLVVMHKCDNPPCVNPNHLHLGTLADNQRDMVAKGRARKWHKLSDGQVSEIRALRSEGVPVKEVATRFGVHETYVSHLCAGRWRRDAGWGEPRA